jgi:hypothetical protein
MSTDETVAQAELPFGTPLHKLVRAGGPDTSLAAAAMVDTTRSEAAVYRLVVAAGVRGITNSEVARHLGKLPNATSPRWSALLEKGLVKDSGDRRLNPSGRYERVMVVRNDG